MSLFSGYRPKNYKFFEPERLAPSEISQRRIARFLDDAEKAWMRSMAVSGQQKDRLSVTKGIINDRDSSGQKARLMRAALAERAFTHPSQFRESDFADPVLRERYRDLRRSKGGQQKVEPAGSDMRRFNPTGRDYAATTTGNLARLSGWTNIRAGLADTWKPVFRSPSMVIPCIQRDIKRQVMFAKGFARKGYHSKKRRSWASEVPC